jgi:hypothetical protein
VFLPLGRTAHVLAGATAATVMAAGPAHGGPATEDAVTPTFLPALTAAAQDAPWRSEAMHLAGATYHHSLRFYGDVDQGGGYIEYDLAGRCRSLTATLGLEEVAGANPPTVAIDFGIALDGRTVHERTVGPSEIGPVVLDVTGVRRVRLSVLRSTPEGQPYHGTFGNPIALCTGPAVLPPLVDQQPCSDGSFWGPAYSDVPDVYAHRNAIRCMGYFSVTRGTTATTFSPERAVTRGEMAALLARLLRLTQADLPAEAPDRFRDDDGTPFEQDIDLLASLGIVGGVSATEYEPTAVLNRGQVAALLRRTYDWRAVHPLANGPVLFRDVAVTPFAADIARLGAAAVVGGHVDGTYRPEAGITRAQTATGLARLLRSLVVQDVPVTWPNPPTHDPRPL